ncbi:2-amino-4-hydroxy-6-hydroxymethyldihydropteridine diphosphokinase [Bacteroidia bacterium]|nr:2-amino-4-hydroxy-6-hydroxymethyldihydropteridine diphosphokinase [Bacteroidia bacterium]
MNEAFLLLGSNLGDRLQFLQHAKKAIGANVGDIQQASSVYESTTWGFVDENLFLNQILRVSTALEPLALLAAAQQIEKDLGRIRDTIAIGYRSRNIDIDLLFYNTEQINTPSLTLPHPRLHLRKFTLAPMVEIAADKRHPILQKTMQQLWQECTDNGNVYKYTGD